MIKFNERTMITVVPFWMDLSASVFYLAAPLVVIQLGGNPIELGLIGTISASVPMILAHLTGRFSDRFGRRVLMVAEPLIFGISCLLMTQIGSVKAVLALAALNGFSMAISGRLSRLGSLNRRTGRGWPGTLKASTCPGRPLTSLVRPFPGFSSASIPAFLSGWRQPSASLFFSLCGPRSASGWAGAGWTSDGKAAYLKIDSLGSPEILPVFTDGARDPLAVNEFTYDLSAQPNSRDFTYTFSRGLGYGSVLYLTKHDGRSTQLLYADQYNYLSFARFSPDGKQIAFIKTPDTQTPFTVGELWVMNADGSYARKLAEVDAGHGFAANWSPDGMFIAFVTRDNPEYESANQNSDALSGNISIVDVENGRLTKITNFTEGYAETPHWSTGGNTLSFTVVLDGRMNVSTVDIVTGERGAFRNIISLLSRVDAKVSL